MLKLIKQFEGFRSCPYPDTGGIWTIGYGSTFYKNGTRVSKNDKCISEDEATELLENLVNKCFLPGINKLLKVQLTDNQLSAILSFTYNLGVGSLKKSTLLRKINDGEEIMEKYFTEWSYNDGQQMAGLLRRRKTEYETWVQY